MEFLGGEDGEVRGSAGVGLEDVEVPQDVMVGFLVGPGGGCQFVEAYGHVVRCGALMVFAVAGAGDRASQLSVSGEVRVVEDLVDSYQGGGRVIGHEMGGVDHEFVELGGLQGDGEQF